MMCCAVLCYAMLGRAAPDRARGGASGEGLCQHWSCGSINAFSACPLQAGAAHTVASRLGGA